MYSLLKPFIFKIDPEMAHDLAIKSLKYNFLPEDIFKVQEEEILETKIFDTKIKNPIGLAAGFDKSAEVYNSLFRFGFGFGQAACSSELDSDSLTPAAGSLPGKSGRLPRACRRHLP